MFSLANSIYLSGHGGGEARLLDDPIVQRTVIFKFKRAQRMSYALDGVLDGMGVVVHRIDAPLVALTIVRNVGYAVDDGVAHVYVGRGHIYLCPEHLGSVGIDARLHLAEELEVLLYAPVAVGRICARLRERAAGGGYLLGREVADVCVAIHNIFFGYFVHSVVIIGGKHELIVFESQPLERVGDGIDVFVVLLGGVGVVHAQIELCAVLVLDGKIYAQRLDVTDVKVAVGLGRETHLQLVAADFEFSRFEFFVYDLFNEIGSFG